MQINRLFEIVYILLNKKTVTAKELAERFDVSVRTIYRDVDTLSGAGIPIYMSKGRGGGISLLDGFILNKSMLSENEQKEILSALKGMSALSVPDMHTVIDKLGAVFNKSAENWIDIDFSYWGSSADEKEKFNRLKTAILSKKKITFDYRAPGRETEARKAEPLQIYFKEKSWYLKAYDSDKEDYRTFKIARMKDILTTADSFQRDPAPAGPVSFPSKGMVDIVLRISKPGFNRLFDEQEMNAVFQPDGDRMITEFRCPEDEWLYAYLLSFGPDAEVLAPAHLREEMKTRLHAALKQYDQK